MNATSATVPARPTLQGALALAALGVVYGDIGTSPLYAFRECLNPAHGIPLSRESVLGVLSLIFWALTLVVTVKYIVFVLRADHDGEGGIMALQALARHAVLSEGRPRLLLFVGAMGLTGTAMFYGDSIITPAISVLSAVEGLNVATPFFEPYVIPLTLVILVGLFVVQKFGTGAVGKVFGPVMLLWFATLAVLGVQHIAQDPQVLLALDPTWAARFMAAHAGASLVVLGSVFLAVTGGEALYADMGHFGARAIRQAWFFVALPALVLNYFGQGALVLRNPAAADNPFFRMLPAWGIVPGCRAGGLTWRPHPTHRRWPRCWSMKAVTATIPPIRVGRPTGASRSPTRGATGRAMPRPTICGRCRRASHAKSIASATGRRCAVTTCRRASITPCSITA